MVHPEQPRSTPPSRRSEPPFEVEDRTDPEVIREIVQYRMLREWIEQERARGHLPN